MAAMGVPSVLRAWRECSWPCGLRPPGAAIVMDCDEPAGFEAFAKDVLLPTAEAAGITTKPAYRSFPVASVFAPGLKEIEKLAQQSAG